MTAAVTVLYCWCLTARGKIWYACLKQKHFDIACITNISSPSPPSYQFLSSIYIRFWALTWVLAIESPSSLWVCMCVCSPKCVQTYEKLLHWNMFHFIDVHKIHTNEDTYIYLIFLGSESETNNSISFTNFWLAHFSGLSSLHCSLFAFRVYTHTDCRFSYSIPLPLFIHITWWTFFFLSFIVPQYYRWHMLHSVGTWQVDAVVVKRQNEI